MRHILAILGTEYFDMEDKVQKETQMVVSQEIIDWLDQHDVEYTDVREKIYICNNICYRYVGPYLEPVVLPMASKGEA
jgi:hypothetical protein